MFNEMQSALGGYRKVVTFENGYSASIVSSQFTYGGKEGLFEIGVLDSDMKLTYPSGFDDVIGYLDFDGVVETLKSIENLPSPNL
jgi:hypothetical protein